MKLVAQLNSQTLPSFEQWMVIQNLGPGNVFIDVDLDNAVSVTDGLKLVPGAVYEFPKYVSQSVVSYVSDQPNTDVRYMSV